MDEDDYKKTSVFDQQAQQKKTSLVDKALQVEPAGAPDAGTEPTVAVDASPKVSERQSAVKEKGTDPRTQDKSTEAWKRDGENQTSWHSHKARSESGHTYKRKHETGQNQNDVINDFSSSVVVRNTNQAQSQFASGALHDDDSRPHVALNDKQS